MAFYSLRKLANLAVSYKFDRLPQNRAGSLPPAAEFPQYIRRISPKIIVKHGGEVLSSNDDLNRTDVHNFGCDSKLGKLTWNP